MRGGLPEEAGHSLHRPVLPGELPSRTNLCHSLGLCDCHTTLKPTSHLWHSLHGCLQATQSPCLFLGPA